jgi:hypothetical protein
MSHQAIVARLDDQAATGQKVVTLKVTGHCGHWALWAVCVGSPHLGSGKWALSSSSDATSNQVAVMWQGCGRGAAVEVIQRGERVAAAATTIVDSISCWASNAGRKTCRLRLDQTASSKRQLHFKKLMAQMRKTDGGSSAEPRPPPRVLVSADRVNFTVQSEIPVSTSAEPEASAEARAGPEAQWLSQFTNYLKHNAEQLNGGRQRGGTLPAVQALYHSSALPNALPLPSTSYARRRIVGILPNGLIGACLTSFTEVTTSCMFFRALL